jgi:hypothetical protein
MRNNSSIYIYANGSEFDVITVDFQAPITYKIEARNYDYELQKETSPCHIIYRGMIYNRMSTTES